MAESPHPGVFAPNAKTVDPRAEKILASVVTTGKFERLEQFSVADLKMGRWTSVFLMSCLWTHHTGVKWGYLNTICAHAIEIMVHRKFYGEEITAALRWFLGKTLKLKDIVPHVA